MGFKIYESKIELLARQILLLLVVFDTGRDLKERIDLLLEIHGNIELTEKTETDIDCYAQVLEKWITSLKPDKVGSVLRFFDVSELKVSSLGSYPLLFVQAEAPLTHILLLLLSSLV